MKTSFKSLAALISITLVYSTSALAASGGSKFYFAPVGGINLTTIAFDPADPLLTTGSKMGLNFGALFGIGMGPVALELGALYAITKPKADVPAFDTTLVNTVNQLQIPLIFRLMSLPIIAPGIGIQYSMLMGDTYKQETMTTSTGVVSSTTNPPYATDYKKSDFGAVLSLQFRLPVAPAVAILLDGRYVLGLTDLSDDITSTTKQKSKAIQALAGISFGF